IIAGFPTETDAMFENSLSIVAEADLTFLHVFPYSPRQGTPAARMPQVERRVARERAARLRAAGAQQLARLCGSRVGQRELVLAEHDGRGRTEQFVPIAVAGAAAGQVLPVMVTGSTGEGLLGEAVRTAA